MENLSKNVNSGTLASAEVSPRKRNDISACIRILLNILMNVYDIMKILILKIFQKM